MVHGRETMAPVAWELLMDWLDDLSRAEDKLIEKKMDTNELRKIANCVIFLDGTPEPAEEVAGLLRGAADEIDELKSLLMKDPNPNVAQMDAVDRLSVCIKRNELLLKENEKLKAQLREAAGSYRPLDMNWPT